jgi:HlyD family secretion protein
MHKAVEPQARLDVKAILGKGSSAAPSWMQRRELKWPAAAAAGLALILIAWMLSGTSSAVHYVTEPVTRGNLTVLVTATGSVQPTKSVDVSSELSGTVRKVYVDYNSTVKAGQLLAELDTDKLIATVDNSRAKLDTARAKVVEAQATVVEKEKELARRKTLAESKTGTIQNLEVAEAAHQRAIAASVSARADVRAAEAQLHLDETNLSKSKIVSPIGGTVLKRSVEPGQTVASTLQAPVLFTIAEDLKQMEVRVDVDEADVGKVQVEQRATFSVDAYPGRRFPAQITLLRFASETVQGVVTFKAVLAIDNSELLLRPGMTATAEIIVTEIAEAVLIPNAGLRYFPATPEPAANRSLLQRVLPGPPPFRAASERQETGNSRTVWVLRNGDPVPVKIVIGASDGKFTAVEAGDLQPGQTLIVDETTGQK